MYHSRGLLALDIESRQGCHVRRQALEQLCPYMIRPALANERVQTNAAGQVVLKLKTPWRDGTTHLVMSPLEFMQRLAALIQLAATSPANDCSAAVNLGCRVPGLGRIQAVTASIRGAVSGHPIADTGAVLQHGIAVGDLTASPYLGSASTVGMRCTVGPACKPALDLQKSSPATPANRSSNRATAAAGRVRYGLSLPLPRSTQSRASASYTGRQPSPWRSCMPGLGR